MRSLATVWQEIRRQPGRFLATLGAIVVSVTFLAATQVFSATETSAVAKRSVLYTASADVVVQSHLWHWTEARSQRDKGIQSALKALAANPDVQAFDKFSQVYTQLSSGDSIAGVMLTSTVRDPSLQWYRPSQGRLPTGPTEVLLTEETAATLGVGVGADISLNVTDSPPLTVVGLTDERGYAYPPAYVSFDVLQTADAAFPPADYRILVNPDSTRTTTPGSSGDGIGIQILVKAKDPARADQIVADTQAALSSDGFLKIIVQPKSAAQVRAEASAQQAASAAWTNNLVTGTAAIALLVGTLIIANTFTILIAQRRRQIGLLRVVGASRGQVVGRLLVEAALLGLIGSLIGLPVGIGLAALISAYGTHSLGFGLEVPWLGLGVVLLVGVAATVLSSLLPIRRATQVLPLEALQPVTASHALHAVRLRAVVCAGLAVAGLAAMAWAVTNPATLPGGSRVIVAAAGAAALSAGVLAASPLYAPALVTLIGRPFAAVRPELRLALSNATLNPARIGATATALMLAVGLIVTVQVGAASGRESAFGRVDERYPADLAMQSAMKAPDLTDPNGSGADGHTDANGRLVGFSADALDLVRTTPGVTAAGIFATTEPAFVMAGGTGVFDELPLAALPAEANGLLNHPVELAPGQIGLPTDVMRSFRITEGTPVTVRPLIGDPAVLRAVERNVGSKLAVVHADALAKLRTTTRQGLILARLADTEHAEAVITQIQARLIRDNPGLDVSGSGKEKANLGTFLNDVTLILTGLLAVAALVALVGVGNTLGLSVIERTRESALLRALGLQRSGLRLMLLVEALLLSVIGVLIGLAFGLLFGWIGATVVLHEFGLGPPRLRLEAGLTALTCLVIVGAGALASVLPGRKAALATPVEALADLG